MKRDDGNASEMLSISKVAARAGVHIQTLRYYERRGLIPAPKRAASGYRQYSAESVRIVIFIKRAQELGFTLREVQALLELRKPRPGRREAARAAAEAKVRDIDAKVRDLGAIKTALMSLLERCACCEESAMSCPILEALEIARRPLDSLPRYKP